MKLTENATELLEIADQLRKAQRAIGADQGIEAILSGGGTLTLIAYYGDGHISTALVDTNKRSAYIC